MDNKVWESDKDGDRYFEGDYFCAVRGLRGFCIYDGNGDLRLTVPNNIPVEVIGDVLKIHLMAYEKGIEYGKSIRSREIKNLLEL